MTVDATPEPLSKALAVFDARSDAFTPDDVNAAAADAAKTVVDPTDAERAPGAAELIGFGLRPWPNNDSPWGTYFGPTASLERADGSVAHIPDIAQADAATVDHWRTRANAVNHPVLRARHADLVA